MSGLEDGPSGAPKPAEEAPELVAASTFVIRIGNAIGMRTDASTIVKQIRGLIETLPKEELAGQYAEDSQGRIKFGPALQKLVLLDYAERLSKNVNEKFRKKVPLLRDYITKNYP